VERHVAIREVLMCRVDFCPSPSKTARVSETRDRRLDLVSKITAFKGLFTQHRRFV